MLGIAFVFWLGWKAKALHDVYKTVISITEQWDDLLALLDQIVKDLRQIKFATSGRYDDSDSPRALNSDGQRISQLIAAKDLADRYAGFAPVDNLTNAYDIQEACFTFATEKLSGHLTPDERNTIKTVAFDEGANELMIMRVVGIVLRDKVLEDKKIPISQVDSDKGK